MSANKLRRLRQQAYEKQNHCCYYCEYPVWNTKSDEIPTSWRVKPRLLKYLKCTAEHLVARQDGGKNSGANVVAACLWCNTRCHRGRQQKAPAASIYKKRVLELIVSGRWHPVISSERSQCRRDSSV